MPERTIAYDLESPGTWGSTHGLIITGGSDLVNYPECPDVGKDCILFGPNNVDHGAILSSGTPLPYMDFFQFLKDGDPDNCCQRENISYEMSSVELDENLTPTPVVGLTLT